MPLRKAMPQVIWMRELLLGTAAMASYTLTFLGVFSLIPIVRQSLTLTATDIGILAATPATTALALNYPAGRITHRLDATRATALSQLALVVAAILLAAVRDFPMLVIACVVIGISSAVVNPATSVLAAATVPLQRRGLAMSVKQTGVTVGGAAAGIVLPPLCSVVSWRIAFLIPGAVAFLVAVWATLTAPSTRAGVVILDDADSPPVSWYRLGAFGVVMAGVQIAVFGYLSTYLVDGRAFSPATAGRALAVALIAGGVGRLGSGLLSDRLGARLGVLTLLAIFAAVDLLLLPLVPGALVWPVVFGVGLGSVGWNGVYLAAVMESASSVGVGRAAASAMVFIYAGGITLPPLLGLLLAHTSWSVFWASAGAVTVVGTAVISRGRRSMVAGYAEA